MMDSIHTWFSVYPGRGTIHLFIIVSAVLNDSDKVIRGEHTFTQYDEKPL